MQGYLPCDIEVFNSFWLNLLKCLLYSYSQEIQSFKREAKNVSITKPLQIPRVDKNVCVCVQGSHLVDDKMSAQRIFGAIIPAKAGCLTILLSHLLH